MIIMILEMNSQFIHNHMDELIKIEDYVPISFKSYNAQEKRADFLKSKKLLQTIYEMDEIVCQKCNHAEDSVKAYNSVLIEWLDCHPEFEGIIARKSLDDYQQLKDHYEDFTFIDLLYDVELPFEEKSGPTYKYHTDVIYKDDSNRMFPDFNRKKEIYDEYGVSLLAAYLAYLV